MSKIYHVFIEFSDSFLSIGYFSKKGVAKSVKKKWKDFFKSSDGVFKKPKNWNPKKDKWYKQVSGNYDEISWYESHQYDEVLEKFDWIKEFKGIEIHEYELDRETLFDHLPNESSKQLAKEFIRDYKIKELTK